MKPVRHFGKLRTTGTRRLRKIRKIAAGAVVTYSPEHDRELAWATVELLNLWSEFCRAYFLSCLRCARLESGQRVLCSNVATIPTFEQAIIALARNMGNKQAGKYGKLRRRDEPTWHQPSCLLRGCKDLGTSHLVKVQSAFSTGSSVFRELPTYRNFYAHRNEDTAQKVLRSGLSSYGIGGKAHPYEVLSARAAGRPQSLILDFIDDTRLAIEFLCA